MKVEHYICDVCGKIYTNPNWVNSDEEVCSNKCRKDKDLKEETKLDYWKNRKISKPRKVSFIRKVPPKRKSFWDRF